VGHALRAGTARPRRRRGEEDTKIRAEATQRAEKAREAAAVGSKLTGRKPKEPHAALARAEAAKEKRAARERAEASQGRKLRGHVPGPDKLVAAAAASLEAARAAAAVAAPIETLANVTDPDSRILKTKTGWVQGYNAQAAVNEYQIVVGSAVTQEGNDVQQYQPMVNVTTAALAAAGVTDPIEMVLADAGYWSEENATADGPDRLIATLKDCKQRRAAREMGTTIGAPPIDATILEAMEHRLRTAEGAEAYARRSLTVEPVLGEHKENRGWRQFRRRGLTAVQSEWALMNASHNLAKLFGH